MKKIIAFTLAIIVSCGVFAAKRALIIGIGDYPSNSGWNRINGDKDIPLVEEMLKANGFPTQNIVKLRNEQATFAGIKKEIESLITKSQKDDIVYIHFSGHGQQITDLDGDEESGLDEAWIPYDAKFSYEKGKYEGQNHIVDDQLNRWLRQIRTKIGSNGQLIVVADACHSGGATRAEEEDSVVVRGTSDKFIIPAGAKAYNPQLEKAISWTYISACKSYQCNYEYQGKGSLTYALSQEKNNFSTLTCQQLQTKIKATIRNIVVYTQTPSVEVAEGQTNTIFMRK